MRELTRKLLNPWKYLPRFLKEILQYAIILMIAMLVFGLIIFLSGKDPLMALQNSFEYTLKNKLGFSEVIVNMIPIILTAVAVAIPSRIGLINVGGEGQFYMGGWLATWGALYLTGLPAYIHIPVMMILGLIGGGIWGAISGYLRAKGLVRETISTLLMNYIAPLIVNFYVFGPWRSPENSFYPQTYKFPDSAILSSYFGTRIHTGIIFAVAVLLAYWYLFKFSRWGLEMRAIGGNAKGAVNNGIPVFRYMLLVMVAAGAIAGLAGMAEVSAIQHRLRPGLSPGYGYMGFLVSWLSGGNAIGIFLMSFVIAILSTGGNILQINQGIPFSVINILLAVILFIVLVRNSLMEKDQS